MVGEVTEYIAIPILGGQNKTKQRFLACYHYITSPLNTQYALSGAGRIRTYITRLTDEVTVSNTRPKIDSVIQLSYA